MCCSVVFGVMLRLLVINISSSSTTISRAAYYQRCVITCETVAVVHRRHCWHVAALTAGTKAIYRLRIAISAYPMHLHSTPQLGEFPSEYCYAVWHRKTRMVWLPDGMICLFVLTTHERDRHTDTDRQTPHDGIGRAYT